jgi:glycosyltransferase involved in cell wall biosynthesis
MNQSKTILVVVNDLAFFISHRLPIAMAAQKAGYSVHVAYGDLGKTGERDSVLQGFKLHSVPIQRGGTNPLADLRSVFLLWRLFRRLQPDLVHLVTIKPVLYGGIAARLARVPAVVSAMAGLGFVSIEKAGLKAAVLRRVVKPLFRWALGHTNQKLIFQNPDDRDQVLEITRVSSEQTQLIRGSGIDLSACPLLPEPDGPPIVAMASRLLRDKGVLEFVAAARLLRERGVSARFWLIGDLDMANPVSVSPQEVAAWQGEGVVECLGHRKDVPLLYAQAHIVTLPSYYGEGLPKSLIEAAACGRAVVTTDMPGCRDAIEPDVSGLLVPPRDVVALADAIERLIKDAPTRQAMGKAGRELAEREFGIEKVVEAHLKIYQELVDKTSHLGQST